MRACAESSDDALGGGETLGVGLHALRTEQFGAYGIFGKAGSVRTFFHEVQHLRVEQHFSFFSASLLPAGGNRGARDAGEVAQAFPFGLRATVPD
jgi:hypothetical protein